MNAEASAKAKHGGSRFVVFFGFGAAKTPGGGFPRFLFVLRLTFFKGCIFKERE